MQEVADAMESLEEFMDADPMAEDMGQDLDDGLPNLDVNPEMAELGVPMAAEAALLVYVSDMWRGRHVCIMQLHVHVSRFPCR